MPQLIYMFIWTNILLLDVYVRYNILTPTDDVDMNVWISHLHISLG